MNAGPPAWTIRLPGVPAARRILGFLALRTTAAAEAFLPDHERRLGHFQPSEAARVAAFVACLAGVLAAAAALAAGAPPMRAMPAAAQWVVYAAAGMGALCILYGVLIEPYRLTVRRVAIVSSKVAGPPLRIVHLSDLHVRWWGEMEAELARRVRGLAPDMILLTGDYTAAPGSRGDAVRLLRELASIAPAFAVRGNSEFQRPLALGCPGGPEWLLNRTARLAVRGMPVSVTGVDAGVEWRVWELTKGLQTREFSVCLYHYPDFAPEVGTLPYDLMLSGHTHGGQIRLPWIGALASASRAGTRYARGLFQGGGRSAFVTQGVGCESYGLPRMRFLCPPEIALIVVSGPETREGALSA